MPRTRINHKPEITQSTNVIKNHELTEQISLWLENLDADFNVRLSNLKAHHKMLNDEFEINVMSMLAQMNPETRNKTIGELRREKSSGLHGVSSLSLQSSVTKNSTFVATKKKQTDEASSSRSVSSDRSVGRKPRANQRVAMTGTSSRVSRSLSRTKMAKKVTTQAPKQADTPIEKRQLPPNSCNFVTPKVKPNTPMVILRRPLLGETAISMQGSPLFINSYNSDRCANVNIPMMDGRVFAMQPNRGLRMSEIPQLDEETRTQLLMLRDNINKVVSLVNESCQ